MKAKKRTYITDILIVLLVIVLSLFILDGKNFYTIPNDNILDYNEDLLYQSMPTAKKMDLLSNEDFNYTSIYIYQIDDSYAVFSYNKSLFFNRSVLNSYTYQLKEIDEYKVAVANQIYNNNFSISKKDNEITIKNDAKRNRSLPLNILNISVTILIIGFMFFMVNKVSKDNEKDE